MTATTTIQNLIDGRFAPASGGAIISVYDPATGSLIATAPDSTAHDIDAAVDAAAAAFPAWHALGAPARAAQLRTLADLVERDADEFARVESLDTGKPLALARSIDIPRAISNLRFFADAVVADEGETFENAQSRSAVHHRALGVAACISPWNLPLYLFTWKIAPALAAGCTVVGKPSEVTPLTAWMLARLCVEAGFPRGVVNIVQGRGLLSGAALVAHPRVACITFTGGTATGESIARAAAPSFKRTALELGGKNPALVFADAAGPAQLQATVEGIVRAAFTNQGQVCHCASRILVERSAWDVFVPALVERTKRLRVGDPLDATTDIGALVSGQHLLKVAAAVDAARRDGATIHCGGVRVDPAMLPERIRAGAFYPPTLMSDLATTARANQEEIFGPVATLIPFESDAEAIAIANGTRYGLSATVWTNDDARASRIASQLDCGTVWINSWMVRDLRVPIGGMHASGLGREGGREALHFFAEPVAVVRANTST
ncbi:MAG: aldehyde dehydrogenase family protein [Phycisphaerales bacterium]|nr:aldehyde dehydrogenase family protein [Phycisphaerales bacterium]